MPYIITTLHPWADADEPARRARTRRAVATLDEAREAAHQEIRYNAIGGMNRAELTVGIERLPESGGTIGPLPDETVIEVEQVTWSWLFDRLPLDANLTQAAALDAFNAS